jgi:hypothetical protein
MGHTKGLVLLAGAAMSLGGSAAFAQQSSDEVRATVAQMLSDAESRTSLLAGGDAGHDGSRFFIAGDGFRLNIGGMVQFRYDLNFRDKDNIAGFSNPNDEFVHGFQNARTKVDFNGELNKDWFFRVRLTNEDTGSGSVNFDYAYAGYKFANGWKATWGQFKLPFLREELVSDSRQLAVERSIVNALFTQGYSQGIEFAYEAEQWRAMFAFSDGLNSANSDFNARQAPQPFTGANAGQLKISGQADYALTGRVEFLVSGNFKQFEDFTSEKGSDFGAMVGGAVHWQQSDNTNAVSDVDVQTLRYTIDGSLKGDSWNLYGAFIGDHTKARTAGIDSPDYDNFGCVVQGGWRFAQNTEIFGRWEGIFADSDIITSGKKNFHFITAGINQYYAGHAAKATADVVYSFQDTSNISALLPDTKVGLLGQGKSGEVVVRLQFQLVF